jgi:type IV pilus assembly protein PilE
MRASGDGFSLVELMVAVAIAGLLAAVALPTFLDSMRKGRRSEAFAALAQVQQAQERWRANHPNYAASVSNAANGDPPGLGLPATTNPAGYYTLALSDVSATAYTATATAAGSQANDTPCVKLVVKVDGGSLTNSSFDGNGTEDTTNASRCWTR